MNAWAKDQGVTDELKVIPDGNGEFTEQMGLRPIRRPLASVRAPGATPWS